MGICHQTEAINEELEFVDEKLMHVNWATEVKLSDPKVVMFIFVIDDADHTVSTGFPVNYSLIEFFHKLCLRVVRLVKLLQISILIFSLVYQIFSQKRLPLSCFFSSTSG